MKIDIKVGDKILLKLGKRTNGRYGDVLKQMRVDVLENARGIVTVKSLDYSTGTRKVTGFSQESIPDSSVYPAEYMWDLENIDRVLTKEKNPEYYL